MENYLAIAAAISILTCVSAGIGIAIATSKAVESIARQPEAASQIRGLAFLGFVLMEATAIYGLLIAILMWLKL